MRASTTFGLPARVLHWVMAAMVLAMLFVGVGMVASVSERHEFLVALHKPLGIAVLMLVCVRIVVRFSSKPPALPEDLPRWQKSAAHGSHVALYALMISMPERFRSMPALRACSLMMSSRSFSYAFCSLRLFCSPATCSSSFLSCCLRSFL